MKRLLLFLLLIPFLQSCFELKEELFIHKEGWGKYQLVADFSAHKEMLQALKNQADTIEQNPFGKKGESFAELLETWDLGAEKLNAINGISNAERIVDEENFILGFKFDFQDISALNLVLTIKEGGEYNTDFKLPYSYHKGKLNKENVFIFQKLLQYLNATSKDENSFNNQKKAIFAQISYKTVIKTSGKIKKINNHAYVLGENEKEIEGTFSVQEILNGLVDISTLIKFK